MSVVGIQVVEKEPACMWSRIKWWQISICLEQAEIAGEFDNREKAAWLSLRMRNGWGTGNFKTLRNVQSQSASFKCMSHNIIFSFSGWEHNQFLLDSWPRNKWSLKIKGVSRNTMTIHCIQTPICICAPNILQITTQGGGNRGEQAPRQSAKVFISAK